MTVPGTQVRQERRKDDRDQGKSHKEKLSTRCPSHGKGTSGNTGASGACLGDCLISAGDKGQGETLNHTAV